jgi:hypothetical protein
MVMNLAGEGRWPAVKREGKGEDSSRHQFLNSDVEAGEDASIFWSRPCGRCRGHTRWRVVKERRIAHGGDVVKQLSPATL